MTDYEDAGTRAAFDALRQAVEPSVDVESARAELRRQKRFRPARARRVGLAVIGAAAVVAGVAVVAAIWTSNRSGEVVAAADSAPATTAEPPSGGAQASCADQLFVYLEQGATDADVAGVRSALTTSYGVDAVVYMDKDKTYQEFKGNFADQPDFVDSIKPEDLSESFRVTAKVEWSEAEIANIREMSGVSSVEVGGASLVGNKCRSAAESEKVGGPTDRCAKPDRLFIYMEPGSTEAEIAGVRSALDATDGVNDVVFFDKEMTYQEFRRLFSDQPDFVDSIKPEDLPVSFRVSTAVPWQEGELGRFENLPGVRSVEDGTEDYETLCGTSSTGGDAGSRTSTSGSETTTTSGVPDSDGF